MNLMKVSVNWVSGPYPFLILQLTFEGRKEQHSLFFSICKTDWYLL